MALKNLTYAEAAAHALSAAMQRDPRVVVLGEDVGRGGIFGQYKGLAATWGPERVIDTPISEANIVGAGVGMATVRRAGARHAGPGVVGAAMAGGGYTASEAFGLARPVARPYHKFSLIAVCDASGNWVPDQTAAVPVIVLRDGKETTLSVTLGRREEAEANEPVPAAAEAPAKPQELELLGLTLSPLTAETAKTLGLEADAKGLAVTKVDPLSEAATKGLQEGDVITEAGQQPVASLEDLEARVTEARDAGRKSLLLLVRRAGDPRFVALSIEEPAPAEQ